MLLTEYLMVKASEEASELACAFDQAVLFGLEGVNDKYGNSYREGIGEEINDIMVFVKLLREEGIVLEGLGNEADLEIHRQRIGEDVYKAVGDSPDKEAAIEALLLSGAIKAALTTKAFTKAITFGIDSIDPMTGMSARTRISKLINSVCVVINLLIAEGVEIPGVGDEDYNASRYEKAVNQAAAAHKSGIISQLNASLESDILNGGVEQSDPVIVGADVSDGADEDSGEHPDELNCVKAIIYDPPSGGDAAPNHIVSIEQ